MKRLARFAAIGFAAVLFVLAAGAVAKYRADQTYYDGYDAALPLDPVIRGTEPRDAYTRVDFTYQSQPDSIVPTLLALPLDAPKPYPCIIFLHGIGQSKGFLDEIAGYYTKAGFAIASFDQYTRGERKIASKNFAKQALAFRRRAALNVIDTRRLVDYLQTRDDIAPDRIYLIGASFGAITGATAVAFEPRIPAAVMTYGGGNLSLLFDSDAARQTLGVWKGLATAFLVYLTAPSDPILNVAKIAPRPVYFQNGSHDRLIPFAAAQALFDAARDPKEQKVYDSDHVGDDEQQTIQVLLDSVAWLRKQDDTIAAAGVPTPASVSPSATPASASPPSSLSQAASPASI